jgi:ubiquinone/menaquinone biosynthesis C-methylase UbiE
MLDQSDALWEWSVFWQSDQLQSCLPDNSAVGKQSLHGTWRAFFDALPPGAVLLDLGTGNGGLATQAVAVSKSRATPFQIHGVDLADIAPTQFVSSADDLLSAVVFHPQTSMEELPFDDATFDAVASQYAIEYSNTDKTSAEMLRVLKPGGCFRFLMHADDGVLKKRCRLQTEQAKAILNSDIFTVTDILLRRLVVAEASKSPETIRAAEQAIAAVAAVIIDLEVRFESDEDCSLVEKFLMAIRSLPGMRRTHSLESLTAMNENARVLLLAQSKRLVAMQNAALDEAAASEMAKHLQALGSTDVSIEAATTGTQADCVGHWLSGRKVSDTGMEKDE